MIKRDITKELLDCCREYPVVTVLGPRQSGKTTLVRMTFPKLPYTSLEDPDTRIAAEQDPRGFLDELPAGGIIDEVQRVPSLLSYIQGIVDDPEKECSFILTGSHQPDLHEAISQSLAGRTAILTLYPFSCNELKKYKKKWDPFEIALKGSYPRLHEKGLAHARFFSGYIQTYIERDVRAIVNIKDLREFQQFLRLLAGRVGQVVNYTSLSNDIGVSSTTVKSWISVLKASFIVYELPPYFRNIRKRVIKSPKIYFTDTGIVCSLLGITTRDQLTRDPLRGNIYENLVITEILKVIHNKGYTPRIYFYRDTHGNEVDLIMENKRELVPVEIKSASTFTPEFTAGINSFRANTSLNIASSGFIVYNGPKSLTFKDNYVFNPFLHEDFTYLFKGT